MMEVFAGFLEHTDHYLGELIEFLKELGEYDNTLIMLISDNGSSAEGGPTGSVNECRFFNNVADTVEDGLAHIDEIGGPTRLQPLPLGLDECRQHAVSAMETRNVPRRDDRSVHRELAGGYHGPRRNAGRSTRTSSTWCPPCSTRSGSSRPARSPGVTQSPIEGVSFRHTFDDAAAATQSHHPVLRDARTPLDLSRRLARRMPLAGNVVHRVRAQVRGCHHRRHAQRTRRNGWELYHVAEDSAETTNLAAEERARLIAMIGMWYTEAGRYNVLPIDSRATARIAEERPQIAASRDRYVLYPGTQSIPAAAAPKILNRPYSISAEVDTADGAEGVLLSMGGNDGGITFYVQGGLLCFAHNYVAKDIFYVKSRRPVPAGRHFLSMEFAADRRARCQERQRNSGPGEPVRRRLRGRPRGSARDHADPAGPGWGDARRR